MQKVEFIGLGPRGGWMLRKAERQVPDVRTRHPHVEALDKVTSDWAGGGLPKPWAEKLEAVEEEEE